MKKFLKDKKGFTLVEILVVLAIMAILIAVAVPVMVGALNDAKEKTALSDARAAYIAYELKRSVEPDTAVNKQDILNYMGKTDNNIQMAVLLTGTDDKKTVAEFYYTDNRLSGKYVKIDLGETATIVKDTFPNGEGITSIS